MNGEEYVCDLRRAGVYTYAQASQHRRTDVPIPILEVITQALRQRIVDRHEDRR